MDNPESELSDTPHSDIPQTIVTLRHEHRYFESILTVLDREASNAANGECDFALLRDIVQYLISYPDAYHHPREDRVFGGGRGLGWKYGSLDQHMCNFAGAPPAN